MATPQLHHLKKNELSSCFSQINANLNQCQTLARLHLRAGQGANLEQELLLKKNFKSSYLHDSDKVFCISQGQFKKKQLK